MSHRTPQREFKSTSSAVQPSSGVDTYPKPALPEFLAKTLSFKLHEWQEKHLVPILEKLANGIGQRILVHAPPQFGKSIIVSKRFPAWVLGMNPKLRVVLAGYNVEHAAGFTEVIRDIMATDIYRNLFPILGCRIKPAANRESFSTRARSRLRDGQSSVTAVGLLSGFTGKGADLLIIDDPYASPDDARSSAINERVWRWWNELAKVRINDASNVLVMFHRYHEDDFAGRLLAQGGWQYYRFPALGDGGEHDPTGRQEGEILSPIRSPEFLQEIADRDPMVWLGQFQGRPRAPEGAFIRREWIKEVPASAVPYVDLWVRAWDLATKADQRGDFYSGALLGVGADQTVYLRDITRFRAEWPDAREIIEETSRQDNILCNEAGAKYEVGVEKVAWMRGMIQDLFSLPVFKYVSLNAIPPDGDKKERASGWVARARNDSFRIVKGHWNADFVNECLAFDGLGKSHDDQIDSVSYAYGMIWDLKGREAPERKIEPEVGSFLWIKNYAIEQRRLEQESWRCNWSSQFPDED